MPLAVRIIEYNDTEPKPLHMLQKGWKKVVLVRGIPKNIVAFTVWLKHSKGKVW